jgi:hypothetical protein
MALGTNHLSTANLGNAIPEIYTGYINKEFQRRLKLGEFFMNRSSEAAAGGKTLKTLGVVNLAANDKVFEAQVTYQDPANTNVDLVIDEWKESSVLLEDDKAAQIMRSLPLMKSLMQRAGHAVGKTIDDALATELAAITNTVGTDGTAISRTTLNTAIGDVASADADVENYDEWAFIVNTNKFYTELMEDERIVSKDYRSAADASTGQAQGFRMLGYRVILTTAVADAYFVHKDTIHWATSPVGVNSEGGRVGANGIRVQSNYVPQHLSTSITADTLFGTVTNRTDAVVKILS